MDNILHGLNPAQTSAVTSPASVLQVLAPPGSGKTKTLTTRVSHLIANQHLKPWNIIVCTFTVKAAKEMKDRIRAFVGDELAKKLQLGTFHSIALRYLKQYGQHIGISKDFGIADSSDTKAVVTRIIKKRESNQSPGSVRGRISSQKAKGFDGFSYQNLTKGPEQQEFAEIFREYDATLQASNLLDYDDLLLRCRLLLETHPQCVSNIEAVLIDEFQDTNNIQYDLMGLFASQRNVITIVGDPDQSIYGFRSAEIKNLLRMKQQWPDTLTINLEENYRSSGHILQAAQKIIEQDTNRPPKRLQATHSPGLRPVLRKIYSAASEAEWLVSEVMRMQALTGSLLQAGDFAVLLRSAHLSRMIESALGRSGVPYRMVGGQRFFDRVEVKLLIDYLRIIDQPGRSEIIERVVNMPARGVGEKTIDGLREEAQSNRISLWTLILDTVQGRRRPQRKISDPALKGLTTFVNIILSCRSKLAGATSESGSPCSLFDLVNLLLKKLGIQTWLKSKYPDEYEARWANIEELIALAVDMSDPQRSQTMIEDDALPVVEGVERQSLSPIEDLLSLFLSNIALTTSTEAKADQNGDTVQQLTISTIHAAKGLEWPVVFIPSCYDGSIPHSRAEDHDEERRLLYVGMTRAQAFLYISCPAKNSQREETSLSKFLIEPGVSRYFEEHGPTIATPDVRNLAKTLKREAPSITKIADGRQGLEYDEDNYWPVNGEAPSGYGSRYDFETANVTELPSFGTNKPLNGFTSASVTMHQQRGFTTAAATVKAGFGSVNDRFEELKEQTRLRMLDERSAKLTKDSVDKPKGRKKQIDGQGTVASFFLKRSPQDSTSQQFQGSMNDVPSLKRAAPAVEGQRKKPLQEIENAGSHTLSRALHKPRTKPLAGKPLERDEPSENHYVFLSSSPPRPGTEEHIGREALSRKTTTDPVPTLRPAITFHTTSMQSLAPQRRTLGMRRSVQGWNARGGKR